MASAPLQPWLVAPPRQHRRRSVVASVLQEESPAAADGPLESAVPRFDHIPYSVSTPESLKAKLDAAMPTQGDRPKVWRPQRRWRPSKKATPHETMAGSAIGGCCSVAAFTALMASLDHISSHPIAHDVPFGLTDDVNQAVSAMLLGFGWLVVSLFTVSSVGLALLSMKLFSTSNNTNNTNPRDSSGIMKRAMVLMSAIAIEKELMPRGSTTELQQHLNALVWVVMQGEATSCSQYVVLVDIKKHAKLAYTALKGATLRTEDLQRNGLTTVEDIFKITYSGKGRMPGFGEACTPRGQCTFGPRLSDEDIQALAEFVKSQADQGWPVIDPS